MTGKPSRKATITRRCFVAIAIPDEVRAQLKRAQSRLKRLNIRARWIPEENIHLTLAFLGDVPLDRIHYAAGAIDAACADHAPFTTEATQLGYFGRRGRPRTIWSGVASGAEAITAIQSSIAEALTWNGFDLEQRPFTPHITIARIKLPKRKPDLVSHIEHDAHQCFGAIPVTQVLLMQSVLHATGPEHIMLHASRLPQNKG